MPITYNPKDVYISQKDSNGRNFKERVLTAVPNSFIMFDGCKDVVAISTASLQLTGSTGFADNATNAISASYSVTSSHALNAGDLSFNGDRGITRQPYQGLNVSGSTVVEFLENFFFPFVSASISINSGTTYYETGSVQTINLSGTIIANSETIFGTGSIKRDGIAWNTFPSASSYALSDTNISSSHSYVAYIGVGNNGNPIVINSLSKNASFIYPVLYGTSSIQGLTGSGLYNALLKSVVPQQNNTISMIGSGVYMYYAYPASYGNLSIIYDWNTFDISSGFTITDVAVTSSGLSTNWSNVYRVYQFSTLSNPAGNVQFNF